MTTVLDTILDGVAADGGLKRSISQADIAKGLLAGDDMNAILLKAIAESGVNDDGLLTGDDMAAISDKVYDRPAQYVAFLEGHGNDNGEVETGFHHVQNDGGTLVFQGRAYIDTVADAIYHFGFDTSGGRYVNEDGASNETTADVAGWLNFFLNGVNVVHGTSGVDEIGSGEYSAYFAAARDETFLVGDGDDQVWADIGNDTVMAGRGNDRAGGGDGRDRMLGEEGNDTLYGEGGGDQLFGGQGKDTLGGGDLDDRVDGGTSSDTLYGGNGDDLLLGGAGADAIMADAGADKLDGGTGDDDLSGGEGADLVFGGDGADEMSGGAGRDVLRGGAGVDLFQLWEENQVSDTIIFKAGDSGRTRSTIDKVESFEAGFDKINLASFGPMTLQDLDYRGGGEASCYYDGRHLRIDVDGDRATDMIVQFVYVEALTAGDFIFA